jgi:hypothetical protein
MSSQFSRLKGTRLFCGREAGSKVHSCFVEGEQAQRYTVVLWNERKLQGKHLFPLTTFLEKLYIYFYVLLEILFFSESLKQDVAFLCFFL